MYRRFLSRIDWHKEVLPEFFRRGSYFSPYRRFLSTALRWWAIPSCNLRQWEGPRLSHISYFFLKLMALSAKNLTKVSIFCFCNFEKCTFCFSIAKILQKVYRDFTWFSQFLIFKCTLDLLCDVLCDIHYDHTFMIYRYDLHYDLYCMDHWIALWLNKVVHFTSF